VDSDAIVWNAPRMALGAGFNSTLGRGGASAQVAGMAISVTPLLRLLEQVVVLAGAKLLFA
jgi:hypothetical protein